MHMALLKNTTAETIREKPQVPLKKSRWDFLQEYHGHHPHKLKTTYSEICLWISSGPTLQQSSECLGGFFFSNIATTSNLP